MPRSNERKRQRKRGVRAWSAGWVRQVGRVRVGVRGRTYVLLVFHTPSSTMSRLECTAYWRYVASSRSCRVCVQAAQAEAGGGTT